MHSAGVRWGDLQYVLAVANCGSIAAAARELGVNHSTVLRRLNGFEARQGVRLFVRRQNGYKLTAEGQHLLQTARTIDSSVKMLERRLSGQEIELEGTLRVTTTDSIYEEIMLRHLIAFQRAYPRIRLDLTLTAKLLDLDQLDADIAIRPSKLKPEGQLIAKEIALMTSSVYAAPSYLSSLDTDSAWLEEANWLVHKSIFLREGEGRNLFSKLSPEQVVMQADSHMALRLAAEQGAGVTVLPTFLGDRSPRLVRLEADTGFMDIRLWLMTHKALASDARVRAFMAFIEPGLKTECNRLSGDVFA